MVDEQRDTSEFIRNTRVKPESTELAVPVDPFPGFSGGQQGSIIYRGRDRWYILGPGTAGQALGSKGPGANPAWVPVLHTVIHVRSRRGLKNAPGLDATVIHVRSRRGLKNAPGLDATVMTVTVA